MGPLVGRVEEQRQIAALLSAVRDGRTQVLFITGPEGIGKSRLAGTVAAEMPTYSHLLLEAERDMAFGAIDRLIDEQLPETAPELIEMRNAAGVPTFAIGVVNLIERLDGPFALVIDDLQNLDEPSQEAFWHVIRRLDNVPALFVATSQVTQGWFAERIIQHVTVGQRGRHIALGPLDADGVQALWRSTLFAPLNPRQLHAVMATTGGVPALVMDLVDQLRRGGGTTLDAAIAEVEAARDTRDPSRDDRILSTLDASQSAALLALALGGPLERGQFDSVMHALGHPHSTTQGLRAAGLLADEALAVHHRRLGEAVIARATAEDVTAAHRALGASLAGVAGLKHRALAARGRADRSLTDELLASARSAAQVHDYELAAELTIWACGLDDANLPLACLYALRARRPGLLRRLGSYVRSLLPGPARSVLLCALDAAAGVQSLPLAEAVPLHDLDDTQLLLLAHSFVEVGRARSVAGTLDMPAGMATVRIELSRRLEEARAIGVGDEDLSELLNLEGLLGMWLARDPARTAPASISDALDSHATALSGVRAASLARGATLALAAQVNQSAMRNARAQSQLTAMGRPPSIHPDFELAATMVRHRLAFLSGEWDTAQTLIELNLGTALDDIRAVGTLQTQATAAVIPLCRGDENGARMLAHVTALATTRAFSSAMAAVLWSRGWAGTAVADSRGVVDSLGHLWASPLSGRFAGAESAVLRVRAHVALGDLAGARAARAQLTTIDVAPGALTYLTHHIDALLAVADRDHASAAESFVRARVALHHRMAEDTPTGLQLPAVVLAEDRARFLSDTGHATGVDECEGDLRSAIALLLRVGAVSWRERLESLLAGLTAGRRQPQGPSLGSPELLGALTRREQEITLLVLEGCSNREIAEKLFVSVRTVEFHVRNALAKLGAASRVELRERFGAGPERNPSVRGG